MENYYEEYRDKALKEQLGNNIGKTRALVYAILALAEAVRDSPRKET